jgi:hypothetical protein
MGSAVPIPAHLDYGPRFVAALRVARLRAGVHA